MIAEVGGLDDDEEGTAQIISHCIEALAELPDQKALGVFYWEPEVNREVLPDKYPLGTARLLDEHTLQLTKTLAVYRNNIK